MQVTGVVGARPNFVKMAPLLRQLNYYADVATRLIHTGQHYDRAMSQVFFEDLNLPKPDAYLSVGSAPHGAQTGRMLEKIEAVLLADRPDLVLVVGDVNSTLAGALAAAKLQVPVAHVEAGLRSFDRTMPEELNRLCIAPLADFHFTTSRWASRNLEREGIERERIFFVGNVMIDSLLACRERASRSKVLADLGLAPQSYGLFSLHRPENVDNAASLRELLEIASDVSARLPLVWAIHPRTQHRLEEFGLINCLHQIDTIRLLPPQGYLDYMHLLSNAKLALVDSCGVQEETTVLGVPCLTMRAGTERPETVEQGTNVIVGRNLGQILTEVNRILAGKAKRGLVPELWDGRAAERIAEVLVTWCRGRDLMDTDVERVEVS